MTSDGNPEEVPPGSPGSGEDACRTCEGTGAVNGEPCPDCDGTGVISVGIGGG